MGAFRAGQQPRVSSHGRSRAGARRLKWCEAVQQAGAQLGGLPRTQRPC